MSTSLASCLAVNSQSLKEATEWINESVVHDALSKVKVRSKGNLLVQASRGRGKTLDVSREGHGGKAGEGESEEEILKLDVSSGLDDV